MKRPLEDGFSLLIGAGLGAAAMYLFDPEQGTSRRDAVRQTTRAAVDSVGDSAAIGAEHLRDAAAKLMHQAHDLVGTFGDAAEAGSQTAGRAGSDIKGSVSSLTARAASAAKDLYDRISDVAGETSRRGSAFGSQVGSQADSASSKFRDAISDFKDSARDRYGKYLNRASLALGREEDHHYIGQTACAVGSLAIGAGLVYFLDASQGQQRREAVVAGGSKVLSEVGTFFQYVGRHIAEPTKDLASRASEAAHRLVQKRDADNGASQTTPSSIMSTGNQSIGGAGDVVSGSGSSLVNEASESHA